MTFERDKVQKVPSTELGGMWNLLDVNGLPVTLGPLTVTNSQNIDLILKIVFTSLAFSFKKFLESQSMAKNREC